MNEHSPNQDNLDQDAGEEQPKWRFLGRIERRVVGVLVEKAKTTPDAYPLTLNSITTACNQKSNRSPQMDLDSDDVLLALDKLKEFGAVIEIQGSGRVSKYKHLMYQWLNVDKFELAVVTELLLRGQQTLGELRARAARMEPIADIGQLRPICQSLMNKNLLVSLTPEGRGQIVDHGLYPDREKPTAVSAGFGSNESDEDFNDESNSNLNSASSAPRSNAAGDSNALLELKDEISALKSSLEKIELRLENLESLIS